MEHSDIQKLLESGLEDANVQVTGEGDHIHVAIVSSSFEGLSRVKRQQLVYGHLGDLIKEGAIHAVTMATRTPSEQTD